MNKAICEQRPFQDRQYELETRQGGQLSSEERAEIQTIEDEKLAPLKSVAAVNHLRVFV